MRRLTVPATFATIETYSRMVRSPQVETFTCTTLAPIMVLRMQLQDHLHATAQGLPPPAHGSAYYQALAGVRGPS